MNKLIQKELENDFSTSNEEKIIEEIIRNRIIISPNLKEDYIDPEEDENDDDILERDKITEEILDNKLSIIIPEKKVEEEVNKNERKINKDIIEDLLIDLFEYHYKGISGQKRSNPQAKIFATKYQIEFFYTKLNINFVNFSKYLLLILEQKMDELIEYIKKNFFNKKLNVKIILDIKKSLDLVGIDIGKIFEHPFEKTRNFDISSVLQISFVYDILNDNEIDINDQEYDEIINISKLDEKDNFENYIEECKTFFEKIENGEMEEEDVEVEEEKQNFDDKNKKKNKEIIEQKTENIKENNEENNKEEIEENNKIEENIKNNEPITVEDLIKFINGNENKKKKKKKRRKKKKVTKNDNNENDNIINDNNNSDFEEKDEVIRNFKIYINDFSDNLEKTQKIKPVISQDFLDKL